MHHSPESKHFQRGTTEEEMEQELTSFAIIAETKDQKEYLNEFVLSNCFD